MPWTRPTATKKEEKKDTLATNVVTHAWNKDHTQVAISPNSNEILIYDTKNSEDISTWVLLHTLDEHDGHVSCIDWCHATNVIVSCAHDRNAYVWNYEDGEWKHTLVILRIQRAVTAVKWSPLGNKFAVSSAAKCAAVCHYAEDHNFWVSKIIKKHKSTVLTIDWCPNNKFIITGSTDMKCRVFSAFIENIDSPDDDGFGSIWPNANEFGECLAEFSQVRAWINAVAWSQDGFRLGFAGHNGQVGFVQLLDGQEPQVSTLTTKHLPYLTLDFLNNDHVIAAGFDNNPTIYKNDGESWSEQEQVDKQKTVTKAAPKKK